jgi:hypothetical protein
MLKKKMKKTGMEQKKKTKKKKKKKKKKKNCRAPGPLIVKVHSFELLSGHSTQCIREKFTIYSCHGMRECAKKTNQDECASGKTSRVEITNENRTHSPTFFSRNRNFWSVFWRKTILGFFPIFKISSVESNPRARQTPLICNRGVP